MLQYILSLAILLLLAFFAFLWYMQDLFQLGDLWLNLGTAILGILLTVIMVDRVVRHIQEKERKRVESIALRHIGVALRRHCTLLFSMLKAASSSIPKRQECSVEKLLTQSLPVVLRHFDFKAEAPVIGDISWDRYLKKEFSEIREKSADILRKYAGFLSSQLTDDLQKLEDSHFISLVIGIPRNEELNRRLGIDRSGDYLRDETIQSLIHEHVTTFLSIAREHDKILKGSQPRVLELPDLLWRNDISPKLGNSIVKRSFGTTLTSGHQLPRAPSDS